MNAQDLDVDDVDSDGTDIDDATLAAPSLAVKLLMVVAGVIGLLAAIQLLLEKMRLLADPSYNPSCSLNPILSCTSVMMSPQANAFFGFPNIVIGIVSFTIVITLGVGIFAGATYRRWLWIGLQAGVIFGILFIHWLMIQSLYDIGKLCLYCMIVWTAMIPLFVGVTLFNLRAGTFGLSRSTRVTIAKLASFGWAITLVWYAVFFALIIIRFPTVLSF